MMRVPTETMWRLVGDAIDRAFHGDVRRQIDAMWQVMEDLSSEAVAYLDWLWGQKNIFSAEPFAPWGRFPADINLIDAQSSVEGRLVGGRDGASYAFRVFSRHEPPPQGGLSLGTSSVQYAYKNTYELQSGGLLTTCTGISNPTGRARLDAWDSKKMAGHVFDEDTTIDGGGRFENQGSGTITPARAGMDLVARGTDWCVLRDQYYWNGAHQWRQVWKVDIHRWPDHAFETHLGLTSFSDTGDDVELVLRTDQKSCDVTFGPVGQSVSSPKDCTHWWQQLQGASPTNPVRVELVLEYDNLKKEMSGAVWLGGERAPSDAPASVPAARRTQSVDVFSDLDEAYATLTDLIATRGQLWKIAASRGETVRLSPERGFHYGIPAPLVDASRLQSEPWDLAVSADVVTHDGQTVSVEVDDGFADYAPEYVRTAYDGVDLEMSRISSEGPAHTYQIEREGAGLGVMSGRITLRPWYMGDEEFDFVDTGVVASDHTILPDRIYFMEASGRDADLFERFGRVLGVPRRPDSEPYLNVLRGLQYGIMSATSPGRLKRALSMSLQVPYRTQMGVVGTPRPVYGDLGQIVHYDVPIGKDTVQVDPYWVDANMVKPAGTRLDAFEPLMDLVEVHDWRTDKALLERFVNDWGVWGTAVILFDANVGLDQQRVRDIERLVRKAKNRHRNYIWIGDFSPTENFEEPVGTSRTARQTGGSLFHVRERFAFGDGVGWQNNTADGDYPDTAQGSNTTMGDGSLGEGISLGDRWLDRYDPQHWLHGFLQPDPTVRVLAEAVDMKRSLDGRLSPNDLLVGRASLRFGPDVTWDPSSSSQKMQGGLDPYASVSFLDPSNKALSPNRTPSFVTKKTDALTAVNAWGETASKWWMIGSGTTNVLFSSNYAGGASSPTWGDRSTPGGEALLDMDNFYVVGVGGAMYHWNGASWDSITSGTTNDIEKIKSSAVDDIYMISSDGTATTLHISSDGGTSWSTVVIDAGGLPESLDVDDAGTAYVVTTNGLFTYDGTAASVSIPIDPDDVRIDSGRILIGGQGYLYYQNIGESDWHQAYDSGSNDYVSLDCGRDGELMAAFLDNGTATVVRTKDAGDNVFFVDTYNAEQSGGFAAVAVSISYVAKTFAMMTHNNTKCGLLR